MGLEPFFKMRVWPKRQTTEFKLCLLTQAFTILVLRRLLTLTWTTPTARSRSPPPARPAATPVNPRLVVTLRTIECLGEVEFSFYWNPAFFVPRLCEQLTDMLCSILLLWMRSRRGGWDLAELWMRSSRVVSCVSVSSQCRSRNCPGFGPGILRQSRGAADEAVLNKELKFYNFFQMFSSPVRCFVRLIDWYITPLYPSWF